MNDEDSVSRIEEYIDQLAKFTFKLPHAEGVTRLAFSPQETRAFQWAEEHLKRFGYECEEDAFLNLHAYDPRKGSKRVLVGTHLDSVKDAGKYDGTVGLISFLEVLHLREGSGKEFLLPVDFVIFRAEESTMFKEALLGSKVATGMYDLESLRNIHFSRDEELVDAMIHFGYLEKESPRASTPSIGLFDILFKHTGRFLGEIRKKCWLFNHTRNEYVAYFETHIEQGKILEREKKDLGIVASFRGPLRRVFTLEGVTDHSGATPMNNRKKGEILRQDALCAASECVLAIERICEENWGNDVDIVGTVGEITVPFSGINKVPGLCKFSLDLRSNNSKRRQEIYDKILGEIKGICKGRKVGILRIEEPETYEPVNLEEDAGSIEIRHKMEKTIQRLGYSYRTISSGAGHDAMQMAKTGIPVCMLFVPCKKGISHSPEEEAKAEDILKASKAIFRVLTEELN